MPNRTFIETLECKKTNEEKPFFSINIYDEFSHGTIGISTMVKDNSFADKDLDFDDKLSIFRYLMKYTDIEEDPAVWDILSSIEKDKRGVYIDGTKFEWVALKDIFENPWPDGNEK